MNKGTKLRLIAGTPVELFLEQGVIANFPKKIALMVVIFLEKVLGATLFIEPPLSSEETISAEMQRAITTSSKLKSLGIIDHIDTQMPYPDEPFFYSYAARFHGSGIDFFSPEQALWKAVGECVERALWKQSDDFYNNDLMFSPYKNVKGKALDIFSFAGFSEEQKKKHERLQFNEETVFGWIKSRSLTNGKSTLCPIQILSARYYNENKETEGREPLLRWAITTGIATANNLEEALVKGILEVIERDAFMIMYLNKLTPPLVDAEYLARQDKELAEMLERLEHYNLDLYITQTPTDFKVSTVHAFLVDRTDKGPVMTVGGSSNFSLKKAILSSVAEATIVRHFLKDKYKEPVDIHNIGHAERTIYWGKEENRHKFKFLIEGKRTKVDLGQNLYESRLQKRKERTKDSRKKLAFLKDELKRKSLEAVYVEMTPKSVRKLGLRSVNVVIPELQPMHLSESFPYFGGKRLFEVPTKLGYIPAKELNREPHPFP